MDHILEHDGQSIPELSSVTEKSASGSAPTNVDDDEDMEALTNLGVLKGSAASDAEAQVRLLLESIKPETHPFLSTQSIKCSECGKIFKNTALANFHAEKSGHDQFEESTQEVNQLFCSLFFW